MVINPVKFAHTHQAQLIAFYLPQYHPIPENDTWWGKGFTEWTNVTKAKPLFPGHYQPHLPADLGFYDLRLPETRQAQADLASKYGIYGFCYYHYWFNGRRVLERPFTEVLSSGEPDFPFCLCWANENWTRAWDGQDRQILLEQKYSDEDDKNHICQLAEAFSDKRYIRVNGKPLFLIYRTAKLPNPQRTLSLWREEAQKLGIGELFIGRVESNFTEERTDPTEFGFDAAIEFQPDVFNLGIPLQQGRRWRLAQKLGLANIAYSKNLVFDYEQVVNHMLQKPQPTYTRFPCVTPFWDNTARRKNGAVILANATPELYEQWLSKVGVKAAQKPTDQNIIFVNAWNEWAEGCHLEPCQKWGLAYLEATQRALAIIKTSQQIKIRQE
ncbi:glycoside hydrolase family 99-like domain-containing protein [Anthocerotibacter panamensis]|uniref:glycoside hydrolase family 99-like domain-containing protein n=1 Tax=Anthocerotibacter panamensis TaxID=2857077 RepID=UPI001C408673|nr:glycoside hydrolase family 99-like domain-containing protein [Anthocerotibacter panamensis]